MKKFCSIICVILMVLSCTQMETSGKNDAVGYICLNVESVTSTLTRAFDKESYNPKQLAVKIVNEDGEVIKETDDHTEWADLSIELPVGSYTVTASSNGFDGCESGFDIPYYYGAKTFTVGKNTTQTVNLACTLATVKVSVNFSEKFKSLFQSANVTVSSALNGVLPLEFVMGEESVAGYFPVGKLTAVINVTSEKGEFSNSRTFNDVQARDHYILNYDVNESGKTQISIKADDSGNLYTYTMCLSDLEQVILNTTSQANISGNARLTTAKLLGELEGIENVNPNNAYFEWKQADSEEYTHVAAAIEPSTRAASEKICFSAEIEGLTPNTEYTYHFAYQDEGNLYKSTDLSFETERMIQLPFGNMDDWYTSGKVAYPTTLDYFTDNNGSWWDSSNKGSSTIGSSNTTGDATVVHTEGGKSAKLASIEVNAIVIKKFAAASLFAGSFNGLQGMSGAKLDWGRPFTSRPKSLHGFIQYAPGTVTHVGNGTPSSAGMVKNQSTDKCSAYIALVHVDNPNKNGTAFTVDNTQMSTFPDWRHDERVVAYAELPDDECVSTNGEWKEINLGLEYFKEDVRPTHIVIVFSSSKYGDYFTGSKTSVLYVDDLELIY